MPSQLQLAAWSAELSKRRASCLEHATIVWAAATAFTEPEASSLAITVEDGAI